jgi:hypothetical protein
MMKFYVGLCVALPLVAAPPVSYERDVQPIFASRCQGCHHAKAPLPLASAQAFGKASVLAAISGERPRMPKSSGPLTAEQVATIRQWIAEGAKDDSTGWWSLQPLRTPTLPGLAKHPIDAFLLEKLQAAKLTPSPVADRRTLIRRLTFDLHGLPPTPAEIAAFVEDGTPQAYERLVDRLLASPRYGERWTRHWMDVIHYGESHGYDKDKPRLNAWPYRDWLIRAFNEDKPYARFVREQIAGDVLFPADPQAMVATGYLAAGPWDFVGHQELKEGTSDKNLTRVLDRDDVVATTISTFTSATAHCARCHDHKFDPIPQQEYYNLQAVFAGIDRADRPFDDDPAVHQRRQALLKQKQEIQIRLQPWQDKVEFASSPEIIALSNSIQDAGLLITHMGKPTTPAEAAQKAELEARRAKDRKQHQALVDALVGPETYATIGRIKSEFKAVDDQLALLPKPRFVYAAPSYFDRAGTFRPALVPRPVNVLTRGSVTAPGKPAVPGALSMIGVGFAPSADEGGRRAALAAWITDRENVLTWRSIVNRVWQYHFGSGIVESANDFGRMGMKPSHPELLDYLAVWFRDDAQGSLKKLHRLMVTSAAYRQRSDHRAEAAKVDGENRLLWRMNRTRIDAEALRDAMLSVAGKLDLTMGGPSVQMFWFKNDHSPIYDYARFDPDSDGAHRRSVYRFVVRSVPDPFMDRLDCPDPSVLTPKRSTTITAIQALAVWNNAFVLRMSEHLAERIGKSPSPVREAFQLALGRAPTASEMTSYASYAKQHGWANMSRVLLNTNEFLFVD